jgi:hypothetical protein
MSRVYKVRGLPTQAADMAALVLFYSPAAAGAGTRYVPKSTPSLLPRVTIPTFPTSVFQPCQAVFHEGELQRSKKLADISTRRSSFLPLRRLCFDGLVTGHSNSSMGSSASPPSAPAPSPLTSSTSTSATWTGTLP